MRKLLVTVLLSVPLALGTGPANASHNVRTVEGTILLPTVTVPVQGLPVQGTFTRQARCAYLLAGDAAQGIFGYVIALDTVIDAAPTGEGDGLHSFSLSSATADAGVVFYEDFGTCDNAPAAIVSGESFTPGDEEGVIPEFSRYAIVVIEGAANANFSFAIA